MYDYYGYTTTNYVSSAAGEGLAVGFIIFIIIMSLIGVAISVFEIIALAKVFKKAGKPGWAAIVPFYNYVVLLDIIGYKWYYIFLLFVGGIPVIGWVIVMLFTISMNIKLAKSFGQSTGFGIGLAFLSGIFTPILGFSKKIAYYGPAVNGDIDFNNLF